ncbi:MAG: hypothetical protein FWC73_06735 [Defluviitaleaceae bacterium]|nr:hypothetical protein [Defluviitaleaceae bacterium]
MLRQNKSLIAKAVIFLLILVVGIGFLLRGRESDPPEYEQAEETPEPTPIEIEEDFEYPPRREPIVSPAGPFVCNCPPENPGLLQYLTPLRRSQDTVQLAAFHMTDHSNVTFLLETDGTLWAWGNSHEGGMGDGTLMPRSAPVKILDSVIYISPDGRYAIREDNSLWGWGFVSDLTQVVAWPHHVRPVTPQWLMDDVHAISPDANRDFVIRTDGSLWALNEDRRMSTSWGIRQVPDAEDAAYIMSSVIDIHHTEQFTIALQCNGRAWTIRRDESSHLMDEVAAIYIPHLHGDINHGGNIFLLQTDGSLWSARLSLGTSPHTIQHIIDNVATVYRHNGAEFILLNDGSLWAMGRNTSGRLGDGTRDFRHEPVHIMDNVTHVQSTWGDSTFAITTDGQLWAWGANTNGQLGDGTFFDRLYPTPVAYEITAIYSDWAVNYAICVEGNLLAWSNMDRFISVPSHVKSNVARFYQIGNRSYVMDTNGDLWLWENIWDWASHYGSEFVHILDSVDELYVSQSVSYAIQTDGQLWAWGSNWEGQVGDGTFTHRSRPVNISYAFSYFIGFEPQSLGYTTVVATDIPAPSVPFIFTSGDSTFYVDDSNQLWSWGANWDGQLGHSIPPEFEWGPSPLGFVMDNVVYVSSDGRNTYAIGADDGLWAWGHDHGPTPVRMIGRISSLYSDFEDYFALGTDGVLWTWPRFSSTPVGFMEGVRSFHMHNRVFFVIKEDYSLWSWGLNPMGVLGDGSLETVAGGSTWHMLWEDDESGPTQILENVAAFHIDGGSAFAIQTNGNLWAWGDNSHGQLGDGTRIARNTPVHIMDGVESVIPGGLTTFAIRVDGGLWAWGLNASGQFGNRIQISQLLPVRVMDAPGEVFVVGGTVFAIDEDDSLRVWGGRYGSTPITQHRDVAFVSMDAQGDLFILQTDGNLWVFREGGTQEIIMGDVAAFFIHWSSFFAITNGGEVWSWDRGWNQLTDWDDAVLVFEG